MTNPSRKWWALAAVGSGTFMSTVDGSIVNIALKTLQDTFRAELSAVEWVVLAYLLAITCLLPGMGRLGDMIGKRQVYIAGFVVFLIGSALCGLAWDINALVGFRLIQAVGAAMIQSVGSALLVTAFPPNERGQALGYIGTTVAAGITAGPVIGGLLLGSVGWQSIFYVNIPIGLIAIILAFMALPNDRTRSEQRFDLIGAGTLGAGLLMVLLAMTESSAWGITSPFTLGLFVAGFATIGLFIWWERRDAAPMINLQLFEQRSFSLSLISAFTVFLAMAFSVLILPFYLQNVLKFDPERTGLTLIASPIALSLTSPIAGRLSDRFGTRWIALVGLVLTTCGLLGLSTLTTNSSQLDVILRLTLIGSGMGLFQTPNNSTIMGSVPRTALGIAGSLMSVMRNLGTTTGIALAGAIWALRVAVASGGPVNPVTSAAPAALAAGMRDAMFVAAALAVLAMIPTLTRSGHVGNRG